ncbi:hypothetical protein FNZ56_01040 [Pseudoluteimonas lycopersici]|uniref:Spore coat protein U domain-containing protein n=1 Tax=Pseudoluteimonas lycopersici TaxID=1324796 RepID=A0A516V224_9GAMM|nr:hypothetical protein [Lysobacter lycopersici]QDQ72568.1 hypothetical protein FNZ56_01040 [Lysobacter lycopersici]
MYDSKLRYAALAAFVAALSVPGSSHALDLFATNISNAAGNCQITDPSVASSTRAKALSLDNLGTNSVWVTCGLMSDKTSAGITSLTISLHNQNSVPSTLSCTAVIGRSSSPATYYPKSVAIGPGAENQITWTAAGDGGGILFPHPASVTCILPPNTGITTDEISYAIELI